MLQLGISHISQKEKSKCQNKLQNRKIKIEFICSKPFYPVVFLMLHYKQLQKREVTLLILYKQYNISIINSNIVLFMNKDRGAEIRLRQQQNKKLEEQTKKMEEELQRVKKIKQMEIEKIKLQQQMKALNLKQQEQKNKKIILNKNQEPKKQGLRNYGAKVATQNAKKNEKKMKNFLNELKKFQESSDSDVQNQEDGQNVRYFLQVMGMQKYFQTFKNNKILNLQKLKAVKQQDLKKLEIPLKDMVAINKKLRSMGI